MYGILHFISYLILTGEIKHLIVIGKLEIRNSKNDLFVIRK